MAGRRIAIIGCGGAGKSTLARALGEALGLPVIHLDQIHWKPGWVESSQAEFDQALERILAKPAWIIDGNYGRTMQRRVDAADTVVFLDLPASTCLWGAVHRYLQYRNRSRPDMPEGNPERLSAEYVWWILTFRGRRRDEIETRLKAARGHIIRLKSREDVREFLASLVRGLKHQN